MEPTHDMDMTNGRDRRLMETMLEVVARLRTAGFAHDATAATGGCLRCDACGETRRADAATVERTVRFEGESNPDDQSIVVALITPCGHRALYTSAYGPAASRADAEVLRALAVAGVRR